MRVLDDEVGTEVERLANDAIVQRIVPAAVDADLEPLCSQRSRQLLETSLVTRQQCAACIG
jgi:hypothetical protein